MLISRRGAVARLLAHRHLVGQLIARDVAGRYKGSVGGIVWSIVTPLLMLVVYLFVFGIVFNPRRADPGTLSEFGLSLFCGMLVHGLFAECLTRAPGVIVGQPAYVKKIVFPLEVLPVVTVGSALFHFIVGFVVLVVASLLFGTMPTPWTLLLPVAIVPLLVFSAGIAWLVASLAVFLRDIGQLTGLVATVLMFLSPVFYPLEALPVEFRWLAQANPLTIPIEATRDLVLRGRAPDWSMLGAYWLLAIAVGWLGYEWFQRTRRGFADVL